MNRGAWTLVSRPARRNGMLGKDCHFKMDVSLSSLAGQGEIARLLPQTTTNDTQKLSLEIFSGTAATDILSDLRLNTEFPLPDIWTNLSIDRFGEVYASVLLGEECAAAAISDLESALKVDHLFLSITFDLGSFSSRLAQAGTFEGHARSLNSWSLVRAQ